MTILKLSQLKEADYNPREITDEALEGLTVSIDEFGDLSGIVFNKRTGNLVAGHQRVKALKEKYGELDISELGIILPNNEVFKVRYVDWDMTKEKAANIAANNPHIQGEFTSDLKLIVSDLKLEVPDLLSSLKIYDIEIPLKIKNISEEKLDDVPEPQKDPISKLGDIFLIDGKHRVMCGDSTIKADVGALMAGKRADMVFTDPPYGMFLDTDFSSRKNKLEFMQVKGIKNGKKYRKVEGDNEDFKPELITTVFDNFDYCKEIFLFGADYYSEYLPSKNEGSWVVWDKRLDESADKMYGSCFELCWSKSRHKRLIARIKWAGAFGTEKEPDRKRFHPNQKPVNLIKWFLDYYSLTDKQLIADVYLGVGSTLIASQQTNRICYGMEIDPIYVDVILRRYKKLYPDSKFECLTRKFDFEKLFEE